MKFKVSIYDESVAGLEKKDINVSKIAKLIANYGFEVNLAELREYIENQYVWCPAVFSGNKKKQDELSSIQLFALDFDGGIDIDTVLNRAEKYKLPAAMYYETMSSVDFSRFRVVFACNTVITDINLAKLITHCLCTIFHESDHTSKDFSKLYFPGKNAAYDENSYFSVYDLLLSTMQYLSEFNPKKKAQYIRDIAAKSNVILRNNAFYITDNSDTLYSGAPLSSPLPVESEEEIKKMLKNGEIRATTIYNNMVCDQKSPQNKYLIYFCKGKKGTYNISEKQSAPVRVNFENSERCQLLSDFINGVRLSHEEWFGAMANLIHIKDGKRLFIDTIEKYSEKYGDINRKKEQMKWALKSGYKAKSCDGYCPYANECLHYSNMCYTLKMAGRDIYKLDQNVEYTDIDTMRRNISLALEDSLNSPGINVIKAPTGAGKTYAYLSAVKNSERQTIVAVPTVRLMAAIAMEAEKMGITYIKTPVIDELLTKLDKNTADIIKYNYTIGDENSINCILRECDAECAKQYLKEVDEIRKYKGKLIITTHARFLFMKEDYLNSRNVIIDEDILPQMMQINQVSVNDVNILLSDLNENIHINKLNDIIKQDGYYFCEQFYLNLSDFEHTAIYSCMSRKRLTSDIFHALNAHCFYHEEGEDSVHFLYVKPFPHCKCTIFSATADEEIYKGIFKEKLNSFINLGYLENKGKLILHSINTYSHNCISKNQDIVPKLREKHSSCDIITFKEYSRSGEVYFGASQGFNHLQGHDIAVIGTFHRPEFVYKLWYMFIESNTYKDTLANRRIKRNGFSFPFMTYSNELLRSIQLWMIESEAQQAVGRARLVNHNCTVHLYSNFPLQDCELDLESSDTE